MDAARKHGPAPIRAIRETDRQKNTDRDTDLLASVDYGRCQERQALPHQSWATRAETERRRQESEQPMAGWWRVQGRKWVWSELE